MSDDRRRKDHQEQTWTNQTSLDTGECLGSLQGNGIFPGCFYDNFKVTFETFGSLEMNLWVTHQEQVEVIYKVY